MAISKLILNGEVQMDVTSDTVEANKLLEGETATKNDGTKVTGTFVAPDPVISALSVTPTESAQTFNEASISGYKPVTVGAIASDYVGSAIPMRTSLKREFSSGATISASAGYYSSSVSTYIPEAVLSKVSDNITVGWTVNSASGILRVSTSTILNTTFVSTAGYVSNRKRIEIQTIVSSSYQLPSLGAQTITPTEFSQTISRYQWLTGSQTIAAIPSSYIIPSGTYSVTENGTYDVGSYASAEINVTPNVASLYATPTEEQQVFDGTTESLVQTGSSIAGSAERPTLSLVVGKQYVLRLIDAADTMGYSCIDSIDEKEYTFTWDGQEKTHRFQGYGTNGISVRITENNTIFISSYNGIEYISWELYVENMVDGYLPVTVNAIPSSYIKPSGTYSVTENGTYDIGSYASVDVSVSGGIYPSGTAYIFSNGNYDIASYASLSVNVLAAAAYLKFISAGTLAEMSSALAPILSSVSTIGRGAFAMRRISTASFENVSAIDTEAFLSCTDLSSAYFPEIQTIGIRAFMNCSSLSQFYVGSKLRAIDESAFAHDSKLLEFSINNVSYIGSSAFAGCSSFAGSLYNDLMKTIYPTTFHGCAISTANFPNVTSIGSYAFGYCKSLTTCNFSSLKYIGANAFTSCFSLQSVYFGSSVSFIGYNAFLSCSNLTYIDSLPILTSIGGSAFSGCWKLVSISIPAVLSIGENAFTNCSILQSVYMPNVTLISTKAFQTCKQLSNITIPSIQTIGVSAFGYCGLTKINASTATSIGASAFAWCYSLSEVLLGGLSRINTSTFACCSSLQSIYLLGSSVTTIANTYVFTMTPMEDSSYLGYYASVYVPASLYDSYISASVWSGSFSRRIVGLTDEQIDPIIKRGAIVNAGRITATSVADSTYATSSVSFSHALIPSSTYVLNDVLRYKDTSGSYHLITNSPGVSFIASVNEVFPHRSTGDVTYGVGCASDHAAFLWKRPSDITDISEVICDYTICEYNA